MKGYGGASGVMRSAFRAAGRFFMALGLITGISLDVYAATPGDIFTVAGGGAAENVAATSVYLKSPSGVAVDSAGNIYIADQFDSRIRKVAADNGNITTVTGNGTFSFSGDGGPATSAGLNGPSKLAVDNVGNIFITDAGNHRIRKVAVDTGIITTVAGNGVASFSGDGGLATSASINHPLGVTVDSAGNLYIADKQRIRKINAGTGIITTVAGNGIASFSGDGGLAISASLNYPSGLSLDSAGNLYIADSNNYCIRKVDVGTGIITTIAGNRIATFSGDGGAATSASLYSPDGVIVDSAGNLYIADKYNKRIRKVAAGTGIITTIAGNGVASFFGDGGAATSAGLWSPSGLALDSAGNLYIADQNNHRIRKVDAGTGIISTIAGSDGATSVGDGGTAVSANLYAPTEVTVDSAGNLYIAELYNHRIRKVAAGTGIITTVAGNGARSFSGDGGAATSASLNYPNGVTTDNIGNLYISDQLNGRIRKVDAGTGIITTVVGNGTFTFSGDGGPATSASISPYVVRIDGSGNLIIADADHDRIRKVDAVTGIITTIAGNGASAFAGDGGLATSASLSYPTGVTLDSGGNLYIADQFNHRIRKVDSVTGIITTVAGDGTADFSGDEGPATSARVFSPTGVAMDSADNLYIADQNNSRIRKIAAGSGIITTVAGVFNMDFTGDGGPATAASLNGPYGVTIDSAGNLYIADTYNDRIRKVIKPDATSAIISYSPSGPYKAGDLVTITATFNDLVADAPVPQIALAGANTLAATNMTKVDYTHYTYTHTVTEANGDVTVSIPTGIDTNGIALSATPSSGETFSVIPTTYTIATGYTGNGSISCIPSATVNYNESTTCTATPADGYYVASATVDSVAVPAASNSAGYAQPFNNVTALHTLLAVFIAKPDQSITFNPAIKVYGDAPLDLNTQATGGGSGSPVTFSLVSGPGALSGANNATLTINGAGNIVVRASQAGSVTYKAATDVQQTIIANKATATVNLGSLSQVYDGAAKSATAATTPNGLTLNLTYDGSAAAPTNAGSYSVVGTINDSNYQGTANGTMVIAKVTPTIIWSNPSAITEGTALSATQLNATANIPGTFVYSPASGIIPSSGTHTLSVTFTPTDTTNYTTATATVSLMVGSNGDINGDDNVDIADALLTLQMAVGLTTPTLAQLVAGDVAPMVDGKPAPDGVIDIADAMLILRKAVGILTWP